jgi:hypothetical protein
MILFPWPKILAATYELIGIYFYIRWRSAKHPESKQALIVASGFWQGLAILTHPSAFFYTLGMFLDDALVRDKSSNRLLRMILPVGIPISVVVLPWFVWVINNYGLFYLLQAPPVVAGNSQIPFTQWWSDRAINFVATLLPLPVFSILINSGRFLGLVNWFDVWLRFYYYVLPGACTMTASLMLWKYLGLKKLEPVRALPLRAFGIISLTGFICGIIFQPGYNSGGVTGESMTPIVLMALIVVIKIADNLTAVQQRKIVLFTFAEFLASRGIQTFLYVIKTISESDPNLILKDQFHLVFAQDMAGSFREFFVCIIAAGCIFMLWEFLSTGRDLENQFDSLNCELTFQKKDS